MQKTITILLDKKMDRKEFLSYIAAVSLMALAGNAIFQALGGFDKLGKDRPSNRSGGYSSNAYGGRLTG